MSVGSDQVRLGNEAKNILDSLAFKEAQRELVDNVIERWKSGVLDTTSAREAAFFEVRAAIQFTQNLQGYLDTLKVHAKSEKTKR